MGWLLMSWWLCIKINVSKLTRGNNKMIINVKHVHNLNKVHIYYCLIQSGVIGYTCKMSHFDTAAMRG